MRATASRSLQEYPRGLGFDLARFDHVSPLPVLRAYRAFLDDATQQRGWSVAAAVVTLFVEGTAHERALFDPNAAPRPSRRSSSTARRPLRPAAREPRAHEAHRGVEGDHRKAAWAVMLDHVPAIEHGAVLDAMREAVRTWKDYRDDVAIPVRAVTQRRVSAHAEHPRCEIG